MQMMTYDQVRIDDLEIFANHGVLAEETTLGQKFLLSMILYTDTHAAGLSDDLVHSTDYSDVCHFATEYTHDHPRKLIEAAAEDLAREILLHYPLVKGITLELKKPWAPIGLPLRSVSVNISRFWHTAYLGLGSNLGDKKQHLDFAVSQLDKAPGCHVMRVSSYQITKPYGGIEQDDFLNACLTMQTILTPKELLERLHIIEKLAHRERLIRWGPRTLDLDILLYDDLILRTDDLIIPHKDMLNRTFVLSPLCELAPDLRHPITGKTMETHLNQLTSKKP